MYIYDFVEELETNKRLYIVIDLDTYYWYTYFRVVTAFNRELSVLCITLWDLL